MSEEPRNPLDRRHGDEMMIALNQRFNDFIERYDRDVGTNSEWRRSVEVTLKQQSDVLSEISPAYNRGKWVVALVMIGSVGMAVKAFWAHLAWK